MAPQSANTQGEGLNQKRFAGNVCFGLPGAIIFNEAEHSEEALTRRLEDRMSEVTLLQRCRVQESNFERARIYKWSDKRSEIRPGTNELLAGRVSEAIIRLTV